MRGLSLSIIAAALFLGADLKRAAAVPRTRDEAFAILMCVAALICVGGGW
jgi:hypothetical protein